MVLSVFYLLSPRAASAQEPLKQPFAQLIYTIVAWAAFDATIV